MDSNIKSVLIESYTPENGQIRFSELSLTYQTFGKELGEAPIVLVNHALTGNSDVAGDKQGWWKAIIGPGLLMDTNRFTILAFDIPGNGYATEVFDRHDYLTARDVAFIFIEGLKLLNIQKLHAIIGGSLGGGIAWEMAVLQPELAKYIIPVAAHWCASDWMIGHNYVQESILKHSNQPLVDARMMALLFYRTPASLSAKFNRTKVEGSTIYNIESWLQHHGDKLNTRFNLTAYRQMNYLLTSMDITHNRSNDLTEVLRVIQSTIIQVGVDSDLFFVPQDNRKTGQALQAAGIKNEYHEITSIHGHDAFLIEHEQLTELLKPYFN
jgi:homoserine O-acetyltransferase